MAPDIMQAVSGCILQSLEATLEGYRRFGIRGEEYPGVIRSKGGSVEGVLYLDVPPEAMARLDRFEGEMYSREAVMVHPKGGDRALAAMVYVIKPEFTHLLTSEEWDFQKFLKHGKRVFEEEYDGFEALDGW
jgi:gamma-glutamylcyclotransferase (GGCT)/AIG2-like uncharacterized protein YtfP